MKDSEFCVYRHISPSGKIYIGITSLNPERRWNNGVGYKGQPRFYNAILKYGWDNIQHEVLYLNLTYDEACSMEKSLIKLYSTTDPKHGYNISAGGYGGSLGIKNSEEVRKRKSESAKRAWADPKRKRIVSEKAKRVRKGRGYTGLGHKKFKVDQFTKSGEYVRTWDSLCEIENVLGVSTGHVSECCRGKRLSARGYKWSFAEVIL